MTNLPTANPQLLDYPGCKSIPPKKAPSAFCISTRSDCDMRSSIVWIHPCRRIPCTVFGFCFRLSTSQLESEWRRLCSPNVPAPRSQYQPASQPPKVIGDECGR